MFVEAKKVQTWKEKQARYKNMSYTEILNEMRLEQEQEEEIIEEEEKF